MSEPLITVGCDFGLSKSGIVLLDSVFTIQSQTLIKVGSKGAERLWDIERAFDSTTRPYFPCDLRVFVEGYAYGAKYQRESLAELGGVMRRYLFLNNLDFWVIPPTSIKKFVTGTGKASKNYMKKCTRDQWGLVFKTDDVCDAYGLSRLGMSIMLAMDGKLDPTDLPEHQQAVIKDVITHQHYYKAANTATKGGKRKVKQAHDGEKRAPQG